MGNFRSIKRKISSFLTSCLVNNAYIVIVETTYPIKFPVALHVRIKTRFAYFLKRATPDFLLLALKIDACNLSLGFKLQLLCYSVKVFRWDEQYVYLSRYRLIVSVKKYLISRAHYRVLFTDRYILRYILQHCSRENGSSALPMSTFER